MEGAIRRGVASSEAAELCFWSLNRRWWGGLWGADGGEWVAAIGWDTQSVLLDLPFDMSPGMILHDGSIELYVGDLRCWLSNAVEGGGKL